MPEIIDIYDENMVRIGAKDRNLVHRDGDWHKAFHCWIAYRASNGVDFMVVQRRGPEKQLFPNTLDITAAGHYEAGETMREGIREVKEELGIDVSYDDLIPLGVKFDVARTENIINREVDDVYLLICDKDISSYDFQVDEVAGLVEFGVDEGLKLFAGEINSIKARTVMARRRETGIEKHDETVEIVLRDFIPRVDAYVFKMLILAKRALNGEKYLVI